MYLHVPKLYLLHVHVHVFTCTEALFITCTCTEALFITCTCTEALFITCIEALLLHVNVFTCFIITCTRIYMY